MRRLFSAIRWGKGEATGNKSITCIFTSPVVLLLFMSCVVQTRLCCFHANTFIEHFQPKGVDRCRVLVKVLSENEGKISKRLISVWYTACADAGGEAQRKQKESWCKQTEVLRGVPAACQQLVLPLLTALRKAAFMHVNPDWFTLFIKSMLHGLFFFPS